LDGWGRGQHAKGQMRPRVPMSGTAPAVACVTVVGTVEGNLLQPEGRSERRNAGERMPEPLVGNSVDRAIEVLVKHGIATRSWTVWTCGESMG
jgi:hypothetical protein